MISDAQLHKFDGGNWGKAAKLVAAASLALLALTVAILLLVDPPNQCPNWRFKDAHSSSVWEAVLLWMAPMVAICCFMAVRWSWFVRKAIEAEGRPVRSLLFGSMTAAPAIPITHVLVRMCIVTSLVSQLPLVLIISRCTYWLM